MKDPKYSRAVEYNLDTVNMIAEMVWEYRHSPERFSRLMGNAQRLPNGNTLINWGDQSLPIITELTSDGVVVYEADFIPGMNNYRTFRFQCDYIMSAPYLVVEPYPDRILLLINKFGDEGVDYFNIYAGSSPEQLQWIDSTSLPWMDLLDLDDSKYCFLEVTAVNHSGLESIPSDLAKVYVRNSQPGDNLILNGDFSDGENFWILKYYRDGDASGSVTDSTYRCNIVVGGHLPSEIQLYQPDIPLIHGKEYILELDARADSPRTIRVELERNDPNLVSYSKHGMSYIGTQYTHIEHTFRMEDPNDLRARFVIYGGGSNIDLEVKNISLRQKVIAGTIQQERTNGQMQCFPNPVDDKLQISFQLEMESDVQLQLLTLSGQQVELLYLESQPAGPNEITLNTSRLQNGAYILQAYRKGFSSSSIVLVKH
jgi:hypothetical protein